MKLKKIYTHKYNNKKFNLIEILHITDNYTSIMTATEQVVFIYFFLYMKLAKLRYKKYPYPNDQTKSLIICSKYDYKIATFIYLKNYLFYLAQ